MKLKAVLQSIAIVMVVGAGMPVTCAVAGNVSALRDPDGVPAVWMQQDITFHYTHSGGVYSCNALERKLRSILSEVGAVAPIQIELKNCSAGLRKISAARPGEVLPDGSVAPRITLSIRSLVLKTPQALALLEAKRGREELKALVRNQGRLDPAYAMPIPAEWKQVRLSPRTPYLDRTDCELIQQLRAQVFTRMAVRVVRDAGTCDRQSLSLRLAQPNLNIEALVPVGSYDPSPI